MITYFKEFAGLNEKKELIINTKIKKNIFLSTGCILITFGLTIRIDNNNVKIRK
jgi:hypothetical protein